MIDLHIHTNYSDGTDTLEEVLKKAEEKGLEYISITDHDTCLAHYDLKNPKIRSLFSGQIIIGVEMKCCLEDGTRIEVLAYDFELEKLSKWIDDFYKNKSFEDRQKRYFDQLYKVCINKGIKLRYRDELSWDEHSQAYYTLFDEIKKYPENKEKLPEDLWEDFNIFTRKYCGMKEYDFFIDKSDDYPTIAQVIEIIKKCNGISFIAHPYQYKNIENVEAFVEHVTHTYPVNGLECYYSKFSKEQTTYLLDYCIKYNLYTSGGTDYHGLRKPDIYIGTGINNNLCIEKNIIANWIRSPLAIAK